ncbi:CHAD domain-containing protein [Nocardioides humilatus]|uniref:CHAD domain-containing protein n=1 Tax=Nocardioides humilatus TaxID=2607660 RepID=A0A5B1LDV4_9ACTN|nr:CHAD domain-containing protein [Nocardioides humilatus]KAA1418626.1 CHAD domain-containing protein [Nocardioides humilatus]
MSRPESTAGEMLAEVVRDLVARLDAKVPAALADEPDGVHQLRTAVRRLRNVLAAFAPHLEPRSVGPLRAGLADYGERLGRARDLEVRADWCAKVAEEVGLGDALTAAMVTPLRADHDVAHADLVAWARSPEAGALHASLLGWANDPTLAARGSAQPASVVAREVLAAQVERVLAHADGYESDEEAAHSLRRAGRRLRHTSDALTTPPAAVLGEDAVTAGELGARIQALLGDHRDALLLADHVRRSVGDAQARSSYAPLVEAAERIAAEAIDAVPAVLAELAALSEGRGKVAGWTSGSAS